MARTKVEMVVSIGRKRSIQLMLVLALLYVAVVCLFEFPFVSSRIETPARRGGGGGSTSGRRLSDSVSLGLPLEIEEDLSVKVDAPSRPSNLPYKLPDRPAAAPSRHDHRKLIVSRLLFSGPNATSNSSFSELHRAARGAWKAGEKVFQELMDFPLTAHGIVSGENFTEEKCPPSINLTGKEFSESGNLMLLPCGLTLASHITVVGRPRTAHLESGSMITIVGEYPTDVMVSQFMMELQGLKTVDGEDPPRILHFNPRLKGDWSGTPVIEQNTCYRMQWGSALRCEGWRSPIYEETVDGLVKCEKWISDEDHTEKSKTAWWMNRFVGQNKKIELDWPFPFVEDKLFVLTLSAGLEGYHVNVDGRHVTSFPYRTGFVLEDATGLSLNGDIHVESIFSGSLPTSHSSYAPHRHLEMSSQWQAPPLPDGPVEMFIGILSSGNHFAERMAIRKSWMSSTRMSTNMVARFFVALHGRKEVNVELKREAEFFGDIVLVPFMDSYDLVVLKTIAICEYGVRSVSAKYIMKCDDDTFVRVDAIMKYIKRIPSDRSLYVGNMNYYHHPLRQGKWAVTYEEWPEEDYPPYANGPGYVISADIACFVVVEFEKHSLRLFKMEDVSMGMWVEKFNSTFGPVDYLHDLRFCQHGCVDDYYVAHYQSPRQMVCMWEKLYSGEPECCNL